MNSGKTPAGVGRIKKPRSRRWWFGFFGLHGLAVILGVQSINSVGLQFGDVDHYPLAIFLLALSTVAIVIPYLTTFNPEGIDQRLKPPRGESRLTAVRAEDLLSRVGGALALTPLLYGFVLFMATSDASIFWIFACVAIAAGAAFWHRVGRAIATLPN